MGIRTITLKNSFSSVNCYLLETETGCILIDTGYASKRMAIEKEIAVHCTPESLKLIIITHGDFDHCGNAAYLREKYHTKIAMHRDDCGMVERGDMYWNRKKPNPFMQFMANALFKLAEPDRFTPDIFLKEGDTLSTYGCTAKILHTPGHSKGSIGILLADGSVFCGDLFENRKKPALNAIMDDPVAAKTSLAKLRSYAISKVYIGHGQPFALEKIY